MRAGLMALVLIAALALPACDRPALVPDELHGRWTTTAPNFEGRYLEFSSGSVIIGQGRPDGERHLVYRVERRDGSDGPHFDVVYLEGGGREMHVKVRLAGSDVLVLENRARVQWRRTRP